MLICGSKFFAVELPIFAKINSLRMQQQFASKLREPTVYVLYLFPSSSETVVSKIIKVWTFKIWTIQKVYMVQDQMTLVRTQKESKTL